MFVTTIFYVMLSANAQSNEPKVTVTTPKLLCSVDQFVVRKGKGSLKVCDKFKDKVAIETKSNDSCKQRAVEQARECLKAVSNLEQLAVKGRFIEQFPISQSAVKFTCELDKSGGSACP